MHADILILRPQPGSDETAARARAMGLAPLVAPLFIIRSLPWDAPEDAFEAVMLTSANAARHAGEGIAPYLHLPCYAVGETTAIAAADRGFATIRTGPSDGAALLDMVVRDGLASILHPCGRDHIALSDERVRIADVPIYAAEPVSALPAEAVAALHGGALALLHSPRAAGLFASLAPDRAGMRIAAISPAAAYAAGEGWASVAVAAAPRDDALLELAAKLCQTGDAMRRPNA